MGRAQYVIDLAKMHNSSHYPVNFQFILNLLKNSEDPGQTKPRCDDGLACCTTKCESYVVEVPPERHRARELLQASGLILLDTPGLDTERLAPKEIMNDVRESLKRL